MIDWRSLSRLAPAAVLLLAGAHGGAPSSAQAADRVVQPTASGPAASHAAKSAVALNGCPPRALDFVDIPARGEPLQLAQITCLRSFIDSSSATLVSPDGEAVAQWESMPPKAAIRVSSLAGARLVEHPNRVTFRGLGRSIGLASSTDAFAWARDSQSLWTVRQDVVSPSGFALSGLVPVRLEVDGRLREPPPLSHTAGPLDGLQWVGADGLALALFGARGGYYRPEHPDPSPTLAIVDAARGQVRTVLPIPQVPDLAERAKAGALATTLATSAAVVLPDGRVRAVLQLGPWAKRQWRTPEGRPQAEMGPAYRLLWTEGEAPVLLPATVDGPVALTPDGARLLAVRPLQPNGIQVFDCRDCRDCPPPPPPTPVKGPLAELVDLKTRRTLWRLSVRAEGFWAQRAAPAISPDGRYALVELPPKDRRSQVGLISMADGRMAQAFSAVGVGSYPQTFGFTADGREVWLACGATIYKYRLRTSGRRG